MDSQINTGKGTRQVVSAVAALRNPRGSTVKDIKNYLVSQGKIVNSSNINIAILDALKKNKLSKPEGARGRFFFWGNDSYTSLCKGSRKERRPRKRRRKSRKRNKKTKRGRSRKPRRVTKRRRVKKGKRRRRNKPARGKKLMRLSDILQYSGLKLKNGRRLIVFTKKERRK
ncbi:hypothetical protein PoB_004894100 [Plakobranchus ocellatus]|uniref:H15 domain-containing protein n=1 Tax=Plakobranchus ocellatus TaxID=259542 RepID=A0AAV4BGH4_9GAST|nr:hypothetical protein PoB_004894100 [Plakobranchus ocellatus]